MEDPKKTQQMGDLFDSMDNPTDALLQSMGINPKEFDSNTTGADMAQTIEQTIAHKAIQNQIGGPKIGPDEAMEAVKNSPEMQKANIANSPDSYKAKDHIGNFRESYDAFKKRQDQEPKPEGAVHNMLAGAALTTLAGLTGAWPLAIPGFLFSGEGAREMQSWRNTKAQEREAFIKKQTGLGEEWKEDKSDAAKQIGEATFIDYNLGGIKDKQQALNSMKEKAHKWAIDNNVDPSGNEFKDFYNKALMEFENASGITRQRMESVAEAKTKRKTVERTMHAQDEKSMQKISDEFSTWQGTPEGQSSISTSDGNPYGESGWLKDFKKYLDKQSFGEEITIERTLVDEWAKNKMTGDILLPESSEPGFSVPSEIRDKIYEAIQFNGDETKIVHFLPEEREIFNIPVDEVPETGTVKDLTTSFLYWLGRKSFMSKTSDGKYGLFIINPQKNKLGLPSSYMEAEYVQVFKDTTNKGDTAAKNQIWSRFNLTDEFKKLLGVFKE